MLRWTFRGACGFLAILLCLSPAALGQHGDHGGMGMGGGMPGGGGPGFGMGGNEAHMGVPPRNARDTAGTMSSMRGGLQLGPPGRWWDDKHFAKDLKLRPDQQRRMDSIFEANRGALMGRLGAVQQEELRLEALTHTHNPDEASLNAQIDKVWQSLADLEKAKTHYLLQIRGEMDADQIARLEESR